MSTLPTTSMHGSEPVWEIAKLFPPQGHWSVEEYLTLTDDTNQFVEFTEGRIEVLAMPTIAHQRIRVFLFMLMKKFVDDRNLGEVLPSVLRVRVADDKFREPDLVFMRRENKSRLKSRYWENADLVVEIVSDDHNSHERDHVTKRRDYAAAGIPEYWIVDPQQQRISVLVLEDGAYVMLGEFATGQHATSRLLPGFTVDVTETFAAAKR